MAKTTNPIEVVEFGLSATAHEKRTTVSSTWLGTKPADYALEMAKRLRALTALVTGSGFETFQDANADDQQHVLEVIDDLACRVAVTLKLAQEMSFPPEIREVANG
jgi:hypothetical protein